MEEKYPKILDLDGTYVRVKRDNGWQSICFSDLLEEEQTEHLKTLDHHELRKLCIDLADSLRFRFKTP